MARIRTIKPEFWTHEVLSELPAETHMLAAALLNYADDEGYFNAHPGLILGACFPLRKLAVPIQDSLDSLARINFLRLGLGLDNKRYGHILAFDRHQRVNRPTPSKIRKLVDDWDSANPQPQLTEASLAEGKGTGNGEGNGKERGKPSASSVSGETDHDLLGDKPKSVSKAEKVKARLSRITDDAIETFNASKLVKKNGGQIASVNPAVGREKRIKQVNRCIKVAMDICHDATGDTKITREFWELYWTLVGKDDFLSGRKGGGKDHANWKPDFDFLTREDTMLKVHERNEDADE